MIYVALLRGINVGGNNIIDMKKLKITFESLGYTKVSTYINSGNILFESPIIEKPVLEHALEAAILKDFQLDIKVLIRSSLEIEAVCLALPAHWQKNAEMRSDVMFLWEEFDKPEIVETLRLNPVDNILYVPGALLWNVEGVNYSKSGMMKLMGTPVYKHMTIRNVNTVRKLWELMREAGT
jgi:uncharacterized protein (DUF1697 family)